jgi:hypothetical protein
LLLCLLELIDLLLVVLKLLFEVSDMGVGALQGHVLNEGGLREDVHRVRVCSKLLAEKILGVRVLVLELGLVDALSKLCQELLFLGSHFEFSSGRR